MVQIRGIALLAACYLVGQAIGEWLGSWLDIDANVGGVGFAMLLLMLTHERMHKSKLTSVEMEKGIWFWSELYIPVIVAMSATQNVSASLSFGLIALLGGVVPTALCILVLPMLMRLGNGKPDKAT